MQTFPPACDAMEKVVASLLNGAMRKEELVQAEVNECQTLQRRIVPFPEGEATESGGRPTSTSLIKPGARNFTPLRPTLIAASVVKEVIWPGCVCKHTAGARRQSSYLMSRTVVPQRKALG